ncbi:MAG: SprT-like domain-containing protein [Longimicrobiales bacterium]
MLTATDFLNELHRRGALRIRCVNFRRNRSTIWSLTQNGTVLNVHQAYRRASPALLDAFATLASEGEVGTAKSRRAARTISSWPELADEIRRLREAHEDQKRQAGIEDEITHCCATPEQRAYLAAVYRYFNLTRFEGVLPPDVPVRLSNRMRSSLGHMMPGERRDGTRYAVEIALNCDLMLPGNGAERADTLLHEMAHVADWLESGERGHGASWRAWARRVGCQPTRLYERPVRYRRNRRLSVSRVPPLPSALRRL